MTVLLSKDLSKCLFGKVYAQLWLVQLKVEFKIHSYPRVKAALYLCMICFGCLVIVAIEEGGFLLH